MNVASQSLLQIMPVFSDILLLKVDYLSTQDIPKWRCWTLSIALFLVQSLRNWHL